MLVKGYKADLGIICWDSVSGHRSLPRNDPSKPLRKASCLCKDVIGLLEGSPGGLIVSSCFISLRVRFEGP